jgi:hypothetical protein
LISQMGSMAAAWLMQAAVAAQGAQTTPEPLWKWWLKLASSILAPLLSTAGSIYVAWRVFHWQGSKDREAWIRDEKKMEWSAILTSLTTLDIGLPQPNSTFELRWVELTEHLPQQCRNVLAAMKNAIFISEALEDEKLSANFSEFATKAIDTIASIRRLLDESLELNQSVKEAQEEYSNEQVRAWNRQIMVKWKQRGAHYEQLFGEFHKQADRIRKIARTTLSSPGAKR